MGRIVQALATGLGAGAIYAIIGMGFSLVFKTTRIVNFSHGEYLVVAGILGSILTRDMDWPLLPAFLLIAVVGVAMGVGTEVVAIRFLRRPSALNATIGTVAVGIVLQAVLLKTTTGKTYGMDEFPGLRPDVAGVTVSAQTLWNVAIACALALSLNLFFGRTRRGVALQAGADDRETATLFGVSYSQTTLWTFGLAGLLGAIGGLILTPVTLISYSVGFLFGLKGFAAAMLGGLGSMQGALVGGLIIGVVEALVATYLNSTYAPVVAFAVLLAVLVFRPSGLFKELAVERV